MTKALELAELGQFLAVDANGDITFNKDLDVDTITSGNVDITGNIGGSLENAVANTQNILGGYTDNSFKGVGSYP